MHRGVRKWIRRLGACSDVAAAEIAWSWARPGLKPPGYEDKAC